MAKCSFCGKQIPAGTGFVVFKKTGQPLNYCSRKCQRNAALNRHPKNFKWASGA